MLRFREITGRKLRVNIISESGFWGMTRQGGHTAFLDCVDLMRTHPHLEVRTDDHQPCDVFHCHSWGPYFVWRARHRVGRRVVTAHALPESIEGSLPLLNDGVRRVVRSYLRMAYNHAEVLLAVAPGAQTSMTRLGVRPTVQMLPNAIRTDRFFPSSSLRRDGRAILGVPSDTRVVLGVGQLQPRKGIHDFVATARLRPDVQFIWVGGRPFGAACAKLGELESEAALPANCRFVGSFELEQMPQLYNAADAFLFPSHQELCPYAPMEAAASGLPVVFRDLPDYEALYDAPYLRASTPEGFAALLDTVLAPGCARTTAIALSQRLAAAQAPDAWVMRLGAIYDHIAVAALAAA
jgi:1,2-diacylglycerol-3-alpha-glucose alpha-1,2-galactosyltransferase